MACHVFTWSSDCCWWMTVGYSYVSIHGVAHREAIAGGKRARAEANPMPDRTGKNIAPCPARWVLTSSLREWRAASNAKSAGAVGEPTGLRVSKGLTPSKLTSAKEWPNGTAGRWHRQVCQS